MNPMPELSQTDESYLAYFKYKGKLTQDGYLDARKAAEALQGIDEVLRFFIHQVDASLAYNDFEIPIMVRKGSWEALIPHDLGSWLLTIVGAGVSTYTATALNKIAENDFKDIKSKDIAKAAIKGVKWVIKIAKHMGSLGIKKFRDVTFPTESENQALVGLENDNGDILYVPQEYLLLYRNCPEKLFNKLMNNVASGRELEIGFNPSEPIDKDDTIDSVSVAVTQKYIFTSVERDDVILFPELAHGMHVELEGHVTRGNENTNTIGFQYLGHVITCSPLKGNVTDFKNLLFTNCVIKGDIDRSNDFNMGNIKRPHIKFESLIGLPTLGSQTTLF